MSALGELESLILLAILRLREAYGVPVRDEIEKRTGKRLSRGAVYTVLARLEKKGYLDSTIGPPTPTRGGKSKRFYSVNDRGMDALRTSTRVMEQMRAGLEALFTDK